ncbi:MAG: PBP1A family penicillin-binding protein [Coriobacteriia bacterium]
MSQHSANSGQGRRGSSGSARHQPAPRKRTRSAPPARRVATGSQPSPQTRRAPAPGRVRPSAADIKKRRRKIWFNRFLVAAFLVAVMTAIAGGVVYAQISKDLPDPGAPLKGRDQTTVIFDRNGKQITKLFAEQNRTDVPLDQIPAQLRQAVIATEDQRFYEHQGVDPLGILRALWVDITRPNVLHGGSTITQQYVKIAIVTPERTLKRKLMEAMLAYRLEKDFSKDEILALYLNTIYFGHGSYGVQTASQTYFGKNVGDLSLAECAMLAGVIKSPGRYSPFLEPENATDRRATVLSQMVELGFADSAAADAAKAEPLALAEPRTFSSQAPYFVEYVKQLLTDEFGADMVYRGGLRVKTTLDLTMQAAAEKAVKDALNKGSDPSAALVAIDPATGEIRAMVGGRDFKTQQYNVAVQGHRQPGSSFKPFVLVTALMNEISPEQTFESGPKSFPVPGGQTWKVTGASGGRKGPMRLREATEKSVNSVFAALILDVSADETVQTASKLGITSEVRAVPAIALGGLENGVTPLEMASAYGTLANGGVKVAPHAILQVSNASGVIQTAKPTSAQAIPANVAYLTTDILKGVITKGTGTAAKIGRPAAGKTGTTQQYRDAWFVGYTPDLVASVWVGYADAQKAMTSVHGRKVTGGSFPAEIWADFMKAALAKTPKNEFEKPSGLSSAKICLESGQAAGEFCTKTGTGMFLSELLPEPCEIHTQPTKITVPDLIGMTKGDALALLKQLMLLFKVVEKEDASVAPGVVAGQTPSAGSVGTTQTVVTVIVSKGAAVNTAPVPKFDFSPNNPKVGDTVTFDASSSTDDSAIVTYAWEFGDGTPLANGSTVQHVYKTPGTYTVTLWVTDDTGLVASLPAAVQVK